MTGISKKILTIFVAVLLACTPFVTAFAATPDRQVSVGQNQNKGNGSSYNGFQTKDTNQDKDKQPQNAGNKNGSSNGNQQKSAENKSAKPQNNEKNINKEKILDIEAIKAAIAGLSDQTAQANLLTLVTAYQTALDTLQKDLDSNASLDTLNADRSAAESARTALLSALSSAKIKAATVNGKSSENKAGQNAHAQLNVAAVQSAIASIDNQDTRTSLTALLTAYQTALDTLNNALSSNADATTLKADRAAVDSARSALLSGLYSAGIKIALVLGNGAENKAGQNAGGKLDVEAINTAIAALSDQAAKTSLQALVTAYQTALDAEKNDLYSNADAATLKADREAVMSAKTALLNALLAAGIKMNDEQTTDETETQTPDDQLDIEAIKTAISGLSDQATQTSLLTLVTSYQAAVDALKNANSSNADEDTLKAYRDAVDLSKSALLTALSNAGIVLPSPSPAPTASPTASPAPSASPTASPQPQTQNASNLLSVVVNWFMNIFVQKN